VIETLGSFATGTVSGLVQLTPDNMNPSIDCGVVPRGEFGYGTGSTLSFPSVSPKKASGTLGRATSFAESCDFAGGRNLVEVC
jgi:hypothetical protein